MKSLFSIIVFSFSTVMFANGQDSGYQSGYVVTKSNDTIRGFVKYINQVPYRILTNVKFKENNDGKVEVFSPDEISGYGADNKIFHSMKLPGIGQAFVELQVDGYLKLYAFSASGLGTGPKPADQTHGADQNKMPSYSSYYLLKEGEKTVFSAQQGKFKDTASAYLMDVKEVSDRVKSGEWKKGDLETIVKEYNRLRVH